MCCYSNKTRTPIANLPSSAQVDSTRTMPPSYIRVHAVVWECGDGQTDRHTDGHGQYTFHLSYASRKRSKTIRNSEDTIIYIMHQLRVHTFFDKNSTYFQSL